MLAQETLEYVSKPVEYAKKMFTDFRELLSFIEEEKAKLNPDSRMYFDMFAQGLIRKYLDKMNECDMDDLGERKDVLDNVDDQEANYASQMRLMIG